MDGYEIFEALNSHLKLEIERKENKLQKAIDEGKTKYKKSFFDPYSKTREFISTGREIQKNLFELSDLKREVFNISGETVQNLNSVFGILTIIGDKDINKMVDMINLPINNSLYEYNDKIDEIYYKIDKLSEKIKLDTSDVNLYDSLGYFRDNLGTFKNNMSNLRNKLKNEESNERYHINTNEYIEENYKDAFIEELEGMIIENKIDKNLVGDFVQFKENYINIAKMNSYISKFNSCIYNLNEYGNTYNKVIGELKDKQKEFYESKEKSEKYISKFNLENIKSKMKEVEEQELDNDLQKQGYNIYKNLVIKLMKAKEENNFELEQEIKSQMNRCSIDYKLTDIMMTNALNAGVNEYNNNKIAQKAIREGLKEQEETRVKINSEIYKFLREEAIKELENSGVFEKISSTIKNGDISLGEELAERQRLIEEKIKELAGFIEMTPEERGLREFKKMGYLPENATLDTLTQQQKLDFRYIYRDAAYEYIPKIKRQINQSSNEETIYREYVKYIASFEDKKQALNFNDFVASKNIYMENEQIQNSVGRGKR